MLYLRYIEITIILSSQMPGFLSTCISECMSVLDAQHLGRVKAHTNESIVIPLQHIPTYLPCGSLVFTNSMTNHLTSQLMFMYHGVRENGIFFDNFIKSSTINSHVYSNITPLYSSNLNFNQIQPSRLPFLTEATSCLHSQSY